MPGHHPSVHARSDPDKIAFIVADTAEQLTYAQLDEGSNRVAWLFRSLGLKPGDRIGVMMRNCVEFPQIYWGTQRSGLIIVLLATHLKTDEAAYIVTDSEAKVLILSGSLAETPRALAAERSSLIPGVSQVFYSGNEAIIDARSLSEAIADMPTDPLPDEISGFHLIYSSGTTGRPKGVAIPHTPGPIDEFKVGEGTPAMYEPYKPLVSFNAGPLYHGAPFSSMVLNHRMGGTFVTLGRFDAEITLQAIETLRINHAQFVPTMFVRLLALPDSVRLKYDVSSLRMVIHGAAPCPVEIKRRMIDWWGPILFEYYSSTEAVGKTEISSLEWLDRPGSVGKSTLGPIHICDNDGTELPTGECGIIYFEMLPGRNVTYLNDAQKTKDAQHPSHPDWMTVGDIGKLDEDGYLFLTDRKDFTIISGGVNIYPQAIEDCLIVHPKVLDAAVIGVANTEYGEEVKAIIQPKDWADAGPALEQELRDWCRGRISAVTCPRSYKFVEELPRIPSGKLAKHELRKLYGTQTG